VTSIAFAGAGWVTAVHGLAAAGVPELSIVHVASRSHRSARRRAEQTGAVVCDYDDLPGGADAVVVATPPALHLREARRAVEGGAAALVEAPLAATLADADELVALAEKGAVLAYGENLVHAPPVAEALRAARRTGGLTHLEVRLAQGRPDRSNHLARSWGGGALFDLGAHAVGLALLLAAPARLVEVERAELTASDGLAVDDDATVSLRFDTGLRAQVRATWRAAAPAWDAQTASATGAMRLELVPRPGVELNGVGVRLPEPGGELASPQLEQLGYVGQLAALSGDAAAGRSPRSSMAFGRTVLEVICAAYASAATGSPEPLPFTGPRDRTPVDLWHAPTPPVSPAAAPVSSPPDADADADADANADADRPPPP